MPFRFAPAVLLSAPVVALFAAIPLAHAATVDPMPFARHPDNALVALSPSGKYVAALVPSGERQSLAVLDLDGKTAKVIARVDVQDVGWFEWVNDDRLVFSLVDLKSGLGEQRGGGLFAIDRDGENFRELAPTAGKMDYAGQFVYRYSIFMGLPNDESDDIIVESNQINDRHPDVYRVNTRTARRTLVSLEKPDLIDGWIMDRRGVPRGAIAAETNKEHAYWRPAGDAKWQKIGDYGLRDAVVVPVAFDGDGSMIVASNVGRDTLALYRWDADKKAPGELLAAHPLADLSGDVIFDRAKNRVVGIRYNGEYPGTAWFDEDWARLQQGVNAALPDRVNSLQIAGSRALVLSRSDRDPGRYFLLDTKTRKLELVAVVRKGIVPDKMPPRKPVRYIARDGLEVPAYLTLPPDKPAKDLPLVVYVHGGPWVRGASWTWEPEPAYLASLGYAVIEPEFRSSRGWGKKLFEAGWKQWGRGMQDYLNDGADWLAKQGIVDPKRVCIMGASYGGYAVMMGLARDPDRWKCGINYVGVTDLNLFYTVTWSDYFYRGRDFLNYVATEYIGDPDKEPELIKAASPLQNASKIKAPVLMVYGGSDLRVPIIHGERMRDALKAQHTPVEWVNYPEEGHGFMLLSNRVDFLRRVAAFLQKHIGTP
jgi:dipeptidyl aminopeptidase/acylaminoacyl peptidase